MGRIGRSGLLLTLDFAFFYELFFLGFDPFEENGCRLVIRILRNEFSVYGEVEYFLTKFLCIHYSSMFDISF